jgi:hypothetical protein
MEAADIKGAAPRVEIPKEVNRQSFYDTKDIARATPRQLHVQLNRQFSSLINEDIAGAKPQHLKFQTNRKVTNPLNPDYELPHFEVKYPEPAKFLRDTLNTADIDGSKPKEHTDRFLGDRQMNTKDIEGTQPQKRMFERKTQHDQQYNDVTAKKQMKREVPHNPMTPVYKVRNENNEIEEIG